MTKLKSNKSMIKMNPMWEEHKLTKKDKDQYEKLTGLIPEKLIVMKNKYWKKLYET